VPPTCGINGPYVLDSFPEVLRVVSSFEVGDRTVGDGPLSSSGQIVVEMGRRPGGYPRVDHCALWVSGSCVVDATLLHPLVSSSISSIKLLTVSPSITAITAPTPPSACAHSANS
jgi:hypothetical protein